MFQFKKTVRIGRKEFSPSNGTFVIAEIGSNHDGSLDEAMRYVHAAKEAGADAVKFQSFSAAGLISKKRPTDPKDLSKGWELHPAYPILDKLELTDKWTIELKAESDRIGIEFMSAPFEITKAKFLHRSGCRALKIASGELTNFPLLKEVATYGIPLIVSTGIATISEVQEALDMLDRAGAREVVLLHCVSNYPPKFEEMNIRAIATMADAFGVPVGLSDHTPGWTIPVLASAFGSCCVEKHVTFDRNKKGPDHPYALEWPEFATMVRELRNAQIALGTGIKGPSPIEEPERIYARKGLYAAKDLKPGEKLTPENTKLVRHAFGIKANEVEKAYGIPIAKPRAADEAITWDDLKP